MPTRSYVKRNGQTTHVRPTVTDGDAGCLWCYNERGLTLTSEGICERHEQERQSIMDRFEATEQPNPVTTGKTLI